MPPQVDIDPALEPVPIPRSVLSELYQHARDAAPEECCGLIVGDARRPYQRLHRCRNEATTLHKNNRFARDGTRAFYMNEHDYQQVQKEAAERGLHVTAIYHSHVQSGAYLSEMDLEHAESAFFPFPEADHLVAAVVLVDSEDPARGPLDARVKEVGLFERRAGGGFEGRLVTPAP